MWLSPTWMQEGGWASVVNATVFEVFNTNLAVTKCRTRLSNKFCTFFFVFAKIRMSSEHKSSKRGIASPKFIPPCGFASLPRTLPIQAQHKATADSAFFYHQHHRERHLFDCDIGTIKVSQRFWNGHPTVATYPSVCVDNCCREGQVIFPVHERHKNPTQKPCRTNVPSKPCVHGSMENSFQFDWPAPRCVLNPRFFCSVFDWALSKWRLWFPKRNGFLPGCAICWRYPCYLRFAICYPCWRNTCMPWCGSPFRAQGVWPNKYITNA